MKWMTLLLTAQMTSGIYKRVDHTDVDQIRNCDVEICLIGYRHHFENITFQLRISIS